MREGTRGRGEVLPLREASDCMGGDVMDKRAFFYMVKFLPAFVLGAGVGIVGTFFLVSERDDGPRNRNGMAVGNLPSAERKDAVTLERLPDPGAASQSDPVISLQAQINGVKASAGANVAEMGGIVKAIQDTVKNQSTSGRLEFLALLQNLTPEDAPGMLGMFRELAQQGYRVSEYDRLFWERWAEIDGAAASQVVFQRDKRFKETNLSKLAMSTWARNDPAAASAWLFSQEPIPLRDGMTKGLLEGMAANDPDFAQEFLQSGDLSPEQVAYGFSQVARQKSMQGGLDAVGSWFSSFSENDPNFDTVMGATVQIYARASFADALNWANSLGETSGSTAGMREQLHARLSHNRPDGLISFLGSDARAETLAGVKPLTERAVQRWLAVTPYAMGTWLQKNEGIRNYDLVVTPFVEQIALEDAAAAQVWAETIRDKDLQDEILSRIASGR